MGFSLKGALGAGLGLGAGLPIIGPTLGAAGGYFATQEANQANASEANKNRMFQERMSSTAHLREVQDLRQAGLNPILSANKGASTPGGAQATFQSTASDVREGLRIGTMLKAELENRLMDTEVKASTDQLVRNQAKNAITQNRLIEQQIQAVALDNQLKQFDVDFWTDNSIARVLKNLGINSGTAKDAQSILRGMRGAKR